jgi:anti-sigma factor RsiW
MNEQLTPISEEELHAYVDGTLSDERRAQVERALEQNPELAVRVSDYFSLNNLFHDRYDRVLSEPVPKRLQPPAPKRRGHADGQGCAGHDGIPAGHGQRSFGYAARQRGRLGWAGAAGCDRARGVYARRAGAG